MKRESPEYDAPITSRVIKPHQCVFAFGIPTSKEAFVLSKNAVGDHYAQKYLGWPQYDEDFGRNARDVQATARRLGVDVRCHISRQEFCELFDRPFNVIILFSHWTGKSVEFSEGLSTAPEIVSSIRTTDFAGIVDLSVCRSRTLGDALKAKFPNCVIFVGDKDLSPDVWLAYYLALFKQLKDNNFSYLDADGENRQCV